MPAYISLAIVALLVTATQPAIAQQIYQANFGRPSTLGIWQEDNGQSPRSVFESESNELETELEAEDGEMEEPEFESPYDEPMETDRHDFTQAPKVVGDGVLQLEYGLLYTTLSEGTRRETSYATPELLMRYGVNERTEFRVRFNYGWKYDNQDEDIQGSEDMRFGIKYQLSEQECCRPDVAVELILSAPTGASALSTGRWEPGVDFIYGWELPNDFLVAASTGVNDNGYGDLVFTTFDTDFSDEFVVWSQSLSMGKRLTENNTAYFEWFGLFTYGREDDNGLSFLNAGFDHYFSKNTLIDFRVGWGLTSASDDFFAGIGGAVRY